MDPNSDYARSLGDFRLLPPEIRNMIYALVVCEPPKWKRPHFFDRRLHILKEPLEDNYSQAPFIELCRSRSRKHMRLLSASKAVYAEASYIFWTTNTFCFFSGADFIYAVGSCLEPKRRRLLQHINIVGTIQYNGDGVNNGNWRDWEPEYNVEGPFEKTIRQCTGLRTLGIDVNSVSPHTSTPPSIPRKYAQVLSRMLQPQVNVSFLRLHHSRESYPGPGSSLLPTSPMWDFKLSYNYYYDHYHSLEKMPYSLHEEIAKEAAEGEDHLPLRDWKTIFQSPLSANRVMPRGVSRRRR